MKALTLPRKGGAIVETLTQAAKQLRASQPFNWCATTAVRLLTHIPGMPTDWFARHLPRMGQVSVTLSNGRRARFASRGDDWICNRLYWFGLQGYEPEMIPVFMQLAQRARIVFDVGAYIGYYTVLSALMNPSARVYAFEPIPEVHERLRRNVHLNCLQNVTCERLAVGRQDGQTTLFRSDTSMPCSASFSKEFALAHARSVQAIEVSTITLDAYTEVHDLDRVDIVKVDTESTEPDVLLGMRRLLQQSRPHIFCEVLSSQQRCSGLQETLAPLGYSYYLLTDHGAVPRARICGDPKWKNQLFTVETPPS